MALIIRIFNILDVYFLNTESNYISSYTTEAIRTDHLVVLAKLIGEIDWAPVNNDLCEIYLIHFKTKSHNITNYFFNLFSMHHWLTSKCICIYRSICPQFDCKRLSIWKTARWISCINGHTNSSRCFRQKMAITDVS